MIAARRESLIFPNILKWVAFLNVLKILNFFNNFTINEELGIITWQDELDVSPETLYSEATGAPLPSWIEH